METDMTREEAIKEIKSWDFLNKKETEAIETLIPELRESEDERIRKELLKVIRHCYEDGGYALCTDDYKKYSDYLEKQKENIEKEYVFRPLAGTDINSAALQAIRRANEGDHLVLAFNGAYIPVRKGCNANKIVDIYEAFIEKQKEQKDYRKLYEDITKSEWFKKAYEGKSLGSDDEQKEQNPADEQFPPLEGLDAIKAKYYDDGFKNGFDEGVESVKPAEWSDTDNIGWGEAFACVTKTEEVAKNEEELQNAVTAEKWLKEIKFKYYVHPVKQEWSEEDEKTINDACCWIAEYAGYLMDKNYGKASMLMSLTEKLKSLRPQPHTVSIKNANKFAELEYERGVKDGIQHAKNHQWKPSDEQMGALNYAYCELFKREDVGHNILGPLQNLIDTLSKL